MAAAATNTTTAAAVCDCGERFASARHLDAHTAYRHVALDDIVFRCALCQSDGGGGRTFGSAAELLAHRRSAHKEGAGPTSTMCRLLAPDPPATTTANEGEGDKENAQPEPTNIKSHYSCKRCAYSTDHSAWLLHKHVIYEHLVEQTPGDQQYHDDMDAPPALDYFEPTDSQDCAATATHYGGRRRRVMAQGGAQYKVRKAKRRRCKREADGYDATAAVHCASVQQDGDVGDRIETEHSVDHDASMRSMPEPGYCGDADDAMQPFHDGSLLDYDEPFVHDVPPETATPTARQHGGDTGAERTRGSGGTSAQGHSKLQTCDRCDYASDVRSHMRSHMLRAHGTQPRGRPPKSEGARREPASAGRRHACIDCGHRTISAADLRKHVLERHTPEDQGEWFRCDRCEYKSRRENMVRRHAATMHPT